MRHIFSYLLLTIWLFIGCKEDAQSITPVIDKSGILDSISINPYKAPMYWDAYEYCYIKDGSMPEDVFLKNVDWIEQNLKPFGINMIALDGWFETSSACEDEHGYQTTHSSSWSHDYAWWAANLKSRGMSLGIYQNPLWVSTRAANAGAKIIGTNIPLSSIINTSEKTLWFTWVQVNNLGAEQYVKGYVQHFADMGIKYLRIDFLSWFETGYDKNIGSVGIKRPQADYIKALKWIRQACDANHMFLSLVMPNLNNEAEVEKVYGHMVRIDDDCTTGQWSRWSDNQRGIRYNTWSQFVNPMDGLAYWSRISGRGKMILDPDFIRINTFSNDDEKKSVISSCLLAGSPISVADQYNTIGNNLWVYQNKEMMDLNADGFVGKPLSYDQTSDLSQTWKGQMSNGDWIVGFFNREDFIKTRSINFTDLGISGKANVRDLWDHKDLGTMSSYSVNVPKHGCVVIKIVP